MLNKNIYFNVAFYLDFATVVIQECNKKCLVVIYFYFKKTKREFYNGKKRICKLEVRIYQVIFAWKNVAAF